jgi:hypothetical protein
MAQEGDNFPPLGGVRLSYSRPLLRTYVLNALPAHPAHPSFPLFPAHLSLLTTDERALCSHATAQQRLQVLHALLRKAVL